MILEGFGDSVEARPRVKSRDSKSATRDSSAGIDGGLGVREGPELGMSEGGPVRGVVRGEIGCLRRKSGDRRCSGGKDFKVGSGPLEEG